MTVTTDKKTDTAPEELTEATEEIHETEGTEESATEPDAADAADSPESSESTDAPTTNASSRPGWLVGALAGALVVALAGAGFLGWKLWNVTSVDEAGRQAQEAANAYAQVLTSIDSNKVDENFDQVLDGATGEFKDMYSQSSTQLRQLLIDNKATAHGVVVESAVQSASPDEVVVLLFVDQSVSNTSVPDPRIDRSRIKMTMELVDGRWRASKVELP
ncbi:hypothetical protein MCHIJ_02560 [Mycolicibacterium chitae]|uniref:Membrane protein n=1 Tax=Mycolicibacterium chitae TaxID=1792 RepID=A0A448IB45_MYCCI|nr:DUF3329 domain-containing protein [Mycolicibacterium chitae]MCV7104563.1 DUF3329 domain-containing protein [Mycolicibacterium chitae]BBZ00819.1 hypothetical protein MCHIJ_02560 [Mycolicibacterium chitae]VEG49666.1 membrane protein [Mycolicibacterium chitae]